MRCRTSTELPRRNPLPWRRSPVTQPQDALELVRVQELAEDHPADPMNAERDHPGGDLVVDVLEQRPDLPPQIVERSGVGIGARAPGQQGANRGPAADRRGPRWRLDLDDLRVATAIHGGYH